MALTSGSTTQVYYSTETVPGTTNTTPALSAIGITDISLGVSRDLIADGTIQVDRQNHFAPLGNTKIQGDLSATLLGVGATPTGNQLFDPFFESALNAAFVSNVLKVGNTVKSFTLLKKLTDMAGTATWFTYKGCQVTGFSFDVSLNAPVKAKFTFLGMSAPALDNTGPTTPSYPTTSSASEPLPFMHVNTGNSFKLDGVATSLMTSFSINLTNGSDANFALGSGFAQAITSSKALITGTSTHYFSDATLYNKFLSETTQSISVKLSDLASPAHFLQFDIPVAKYSAATQVVSSDNTLIVTMPWTALYDPTTSTSLSITRG